MMPRSRFLQAALALLFASAVWLPSVHLFFATDPSAAFSEQKIPPAAAELAARHVDVWSRAEEIARMHEASGEWDFMGRTYVAWSLANMALRDPSRRDDYLAPLDRIIADTLRLEREHGLLYFLLPYARARPFVESPARSLFVDGEIALMLALRRLVAEDDAAKREFDLRAAFISERMARGPVASAESYPNECWMFCNAVALAALRVGDALDRTDHGPLARRFVETAKAKLVDPTSGLLVSRYALDGTVMEGPEGSSIWMVAHALEIVDESFARDQYARAKAQLARSVLGFGFAVEWPSTHVGASDIDSGPIVPFLSASAGSSGLALVASKSFGDRATFRSLLTTLDFAAFPTRTRRGTTSERRYAASNQVGDAVILYAMVLGPAWSQVKARLAR